MITVRVNKNMQKNKQNIKTEKEYITLKDRTVVYYVKIDTVSDEQVEDMMTESVSYEYQESYS